MPTNRRRRPQSRRGDVAELDFCHEYHLLHGYWMIEGFETREEFEAAWDYHGERLLAEWVEEHPGSRPFAWWLIDHGKERPVIDGRPTAQQFAAACREDIGGRVTFGFLHMHTEPPLQEDETDYLDRLQLLTDTERAALDRLGRRDDSLSCP